MDSRLFWLALAAFVGSTEGGLIAGVLPSISRDMGVTIGQAGLIMVGYALAYAIGTPLLAVVLGGVGRRRILAWSELGLAVCALLIALAPVFPMIVGLRTILAVCAGTFTGTAMATAAMSRAWPARIVGSGPMRSLSHPMTGESANIPAMCRLMVIPMIRSVAP